MTQSMHELGEGGGGGVQVGAMSTSMHSSRMLTARLLSVSSSMHCTGAGVSAQEGVLQHPPVNRMTDSTLPQLCCGR